MTETSQPVRERTIGDYLATLASHAPTPGGGSVAGIVAALSMCLGRMVVSLSETSEELIEANECLRMATDRALAASDADERAYGGYVAATKLPKASSEEKAARKRAMQDALHNAAETPMRLAELVAAMRPVLRTVADRGNSHVVSDAAVALRLADTAIEICLINVRVNLPYLKDKQFAAALEQRISAL